MITAKRAHMHVAAITHPGMRGKNNEDRYGVSAYTLESGNRVPSVLAVVADGIGGHRAGEVAAQVAVDMISQVVAASDGSQPEATLREAVIQASEAIRSQAASDPAKKGMGATCVCAWVIGDRLYTASAGDSRLYLLRNQAIRRLSIDHTWIQEALEAGAINPEQAKVHPNAHVIRRYLGSPQQVVPDLRLRLSPAESDREAEANQGLRLLPGDVLLLCSDGLHDLVEDGEILEMMSEGSLEEGMEALVNLANERGGHDNITIVSMQMPAAGAAPEVSRVIPAATSAQEITQEYHPAAGAAAAAQAAQVDKAAVPEPRARPRRISWITCGFLAVLLVLALGTWGIAGWIAAQPAATATPTATRRVTLTVSPQASPSPTISPTTRKTSTTTPQPTSGTPGSPFIPLPQDGQPTITPWPTNTPPPF